MTATETALRDLLAEVLPGGVPPASIGREAPLRELGLDSVGLLALITGLEKTFTVKIEDEDLEDAAFSTLRALDAFVTGKLARAPR